MMSEEPGVRICEIRPAAYRAWALRRAFNGQDLDGDDRRMIEVVERAVEQMRAEQLTHPER
jgi:hypothetical protein